MKKKKSVSKYNLLTVILKKKKIPTLLFADLDKNS